MHNSICISKQRIGQSRIADITLNKGKTIFWNALEIRTIPCIGQLIEHRHLDIRFILNDPMHEVRTDKTSSTSNDDSFWTKL